VFVTIELTQQLAELNPAERRALLARLRDRRQGDDRPAPLTRRADTGLVPLSSAQERLWLLDRLDPGDPTYNLAFGVRITGPLDPDRLRQAIATVVRRHDALRTRFVVADGQVSQEVLPAQPIALPTIDVPDPAIRFDLTEGRPFAVRLLVVDPTEHVLLVVVHHIVFDGWSTAVFVDELVAAYQGTELPELPVAFTDWATWENTQLASPRLAGQLDYWTDRLAGAPVLSTVPPDRPRPDMPAHRGGHLPVRLDNRLTDAVSTMAKAAGATLNAVLLAGFAAVLYRLTGETDVVLGVPVAGRKHTALEPLIGNFANTFVLRVDLSGDPTPAELVRRTHQALRDAFAHQDVPYAAVVERVAPPRTRGHNPLFQVMLSIADIPQQPRVAGATTFTLEETQTGRTDFDLFLTLSRVDGEIRGQLGYDADLYLPDTVERTLAALTDVLAEFTAAPHQPIRSHLAVLTVAATFTADPVRAPLEFWQRFLGAPAEVRIAPYGQVVQTLLGAPPDTDLFVLVRWEDWLPGRARTREPDPAGAAGVLEPALDDLVAAVTDLRARSAAPLVLGITPPSAAFAGRPWTGLFASLEDRLAARCARLADVLVIPAGQWSRRYPTASVADATADLLGHVPYTSEFFAAIGTRLARERYARWARPTTTVVLDPGDNAVLRREITRQQRFGRHVVSSVDQLGDIDPAGCLIIEPDPAARDTLRARFPEATVVDVPADPAHLWPLDRPVARPGSAVVAGDRLAYLAAELTDASVIERRCRPVARTVAPDTGPAVAPRDETERRVAALWADALGRDEIGVTTDFFALGGHSLLATRLLSRVHAEFGRHVPLAAFFAQPTVERLAQQIGTDDADDPIRPAPDAEPAVSPTQERLWALAWLGDDPARHNITFAATLRGTLDVAALRHAVEEIVRRHEVLRTTFVERDGHPVPVVHDEPTCWLPDLAGSVTDHIARHAGEPYDLAAGPLVRARLLRTDEHEHHLLLGTHHIVSDNWSWGVFLSELDELYTAFAAGRPTPLAPLPVQFADYVAWLRRRPADPANGSYWRETLAGAPPVLDLGDRPRPAVRSDRAARCEHTFRTGLDARLRSLGGGEAGSLFSVLLAGFGVLLHRHGGTDDLVVGTPTAGRARPELDRLIGYFADVLPFRLDLAGRPTFRELVRRVHSRVVAGQRHELPLSEIMDIAAPPRNAAYHPLFQHMFNFVDQQEHPLSLGDVEVIELDVPVTGTDFDLFLTLSLRDDRLHATLDHSADLFDPDTAQKLLASFEALLTAAAAEPDTTVDRLDPGPDFRAPQQKTAAAWPVAVAASFTAEPARAVLEHWLRVAGLPASVEFAPYAQVLQQLLDPSGQLGAADGVNVVLLRWVDWLRDRGPVTIVGAAELLDREFHDLCAAVRAFAERSSAPLVLGICPPPPDFAGPDWTTLFGGLTERLTRFAGTLPRVTVRSMSQWIKPYRVADVCDTHADELAHMPYSTEFYAVLATGIAREVWRLRGPGIRTIVLDLDGDLGTPLLRTLRGQLRAGRRLVLCPSGPADRWTAAIAEGRLPLHPSEVVVGPGDTPLADQLDALVVSGTVEPADCLVLTSDSVGDRFRAVSPTDDTLAHVWWLDPPADDAEPDPNCHADPPELRTPTDAATLVAIAGGPRTTGHERYVAPRTERERVVAQVWSELLRTDRIGIHDDFFALGGDSMLAIQVVSLAARRGVALTPRQLLTHPTVAQLADAPTPAAIHAEVDDGDTPLTPPQRWFFEVIAPAMANPSHFNHPYYLELNEPIPPADLRDALRQLPDHHDALRLRFTPDATNGWHQHHARDAEPPFDSHDLTGLDRPAQDARMVELASAAQAALDITAGPTVRALHFALGDRPDRLLIVNHHLVVDAVSRGTLLADLETLLNKPIPTATTSYQDWSRRLAEHARSDQVLARLPFWLAQARPAGTNLPVDFPGGRPTYGSMRTLSATLDPPDTESVRAAARALGMKLGELAVGVVAQVLAARQGGGDVALAVAGHGRENLFGDVDLSRTVGWFQVYYPLLIRTPGNGLAGVRDQLAAVPDNGIDYGLLRFGAAAEAFAAVPAPQVSVNYMGEFGFADTPTGTGLFGVPDGDFGPPQDETGEWPYLVDVVTSTVGGRLRVELNHSVDVHRTETARALLDDVVARFVAVATDPDRNKEMI
jgi:non-ribosomal peptide synthase protein (TIGR01720 family)